MSTSTTGDSGSAPAPVIVATGSGGGGGGGYHRTSSPSQPELLSAFNADPAMAGFQKFADAAIQNMAGTFLALLQSYHKQTHKINYIETRVTSAVGIANGCEQKMNECELQLKKESERASERFNEFRKDMTKEAHDLRRDHETVSRRVMHGLDGMDRDMNAANTRMKALELRLARCEAIQGMPIDDHTLADLMGLAAAANASSAAALTSGQPLPPRVHTPNPPNTQRPIRTADSTSDERLAVDEPIGGARPKSGAASAAPSATEPAVAATGTNTAGQNATTTGTGPTPTGTGGGSESKPATEDPAITKSTAYPAAAAFAAAFVASAKEKAAAAAAAAAKATATGTNTQSATSSGAAGAIDSTAPPTGSGGSSASLTTTGAGSTTTTGTPAAPGSAMRPSKPSGAGTTTTTTTSIKTTDSKQQQLTLLQQFQAQQAGLRGTAGSTTVVGGSGSSSTGGGGLQPLPIPVTGSVSVSNLGNVLAVTNATFNTRLEYHERVLANLESTLRAVLGNLEEIVARLNADASDKKRTEQTLMSTIESLNDLGTKFTVQNQVLEKQIVTYKADFDRALELKLSLIEKAVGKELDTMALDKASKQELDHVNQRLLMITEKTVERDEYSKALNEISSAMADTIEERRRHIREIANQLQVIVQAVASKASKSDLIDVASVLNTFPQVALELEQLKEFVQITISEKTDRLIENSVDRKQLRTTLQHLMRRLKTELSALVGPATGAGGSAGGTHTCETCAVRLGTHSGPACLSCSAKLMKLNPAAVTALEAGTGSGGSAIASSALNGELSSSPDREMIGARGGGFSLARPKRTPLQPDPSAMLGIGAMYGVPATPTPPVVIGTGAAIAGNSASLLPSGPLLFASPPVAGGAQAAVLGRRPSRTATGSGAISPAKLKGLGAPLIPTSVTTPGPTDPLQLQPVAMTHTVPDTSAVLVVPQPTHAVIIPQPPLPSQSSSSQQLLDEKYNPISEQKMAAGSGPAAAIQLAAAEQFAGGGGGSAALSIDSGRSVGGWNGIKMTESAADGRLYPATGTGRTHRMIISPRGKPRAYKRVETTATGVNDAPTQPQPSPALSAPPPSVHTTTVPPTGSADKSTKPKASSGGAAGAAGGHGIGHHTAAKHPHKPAAQPWDN